MSVHLEIVEPGLGTTLQDLGRRGFQRFGISASGVMDPIGLATANALVGNKAETAALEITLAGPTLTCPGADIRIALAGADFAVSIDGRPVSSHETHDLRAGQRLSIGTTRDGVRAVLAISGGFQVTPMLGSVSTHSRSQLGGLDGGPLRAGDRLPLAVPGLPARPHLMVCPRRIAAARKDLFACSSARRTMPSATRGSRPSSPPTTPSRHYPTAWDAGSKGRGFSTRARWASSLTARCSAAPDSRQRPADHPARRSPDHRRISEDRHRDLGGPAAASSAPPRPTRALSGSRGRRRREART